MKKREYEKFVRELNKQLTQLRANPAYGTPAGSFISGYGSALLWVYDQLGESEPEWPTLPTPPAGA